MKRVMVRAIRRIRVFQCWWRRASWSDRFVGMLAAFAILRILICDSVASGLDLTLVLARLSGRT